MEETEQTQYIVDQLASARCQQELDIELAKISEPDWQVFLRTMQDQLRRMETEQPEQARLFRSVLFSYIERRRYTTF